MPRGPGGLVVSSSPPPAGKDPDFAQTAAMLTVLNQVNIKLKTQALQDEAEG